MENVAATSAPKARKNNEKKAKAYNIFEANKDKKSSDIARLIQAELNITFANAQYYVTRVFKK
jgi:hypothetical protein